MIQKNPKYSDQENSLDSESNPYYQRFPFIGDNTYLIAKIEPKTKKQLLIFEKINPNTKEIEFRDELVCIHTAIAKISYDQYAELANNSESMQKFNLNAINAQTTEKRNNSREEISEEIDLDIDEKFFAFKSWVQGIAEAGEDAFKLQSEIDRALPASMPIARFLIDCMISINPSYIFEYINKIEKECRFEGVYHRASLYANLYFLLEYLEDLANEFQKFENLKQYVLAIAEIDSDFLFDYLKQFDYEKELRDCEGNRLYSQLRLEIASDGDFLHFPEFRKLFLAQQKHILYRLIRNPGARKMSDFGLLKYSSDYIISKTAWSYSLNDRLKKSGDKITLDNRKLPIYDENYYLWKKKDKLLFFSASQRDAISRGEYI